MANYPSVITSFPIPTSSSRLNNPSHSGLENLQSSTIAQIEAVIGLSGDSAGTIIGDLRSSNSSGGGHVQTAALGGTGQTTFIKGDILVASSSSVLSKVAIGTNGQVPIADSTQPAGIRWGTSPNPITTVSIISGTTWVKPVSASILYVEVWGGGGSGGAGGGTNKMGGGGGGGYVAGYVNNSLLPSTVNITIGKGGDSVAPLSNGQAGGTTSFNNVLIAYGGGAGTGGSGGGGGGAGNLNSGSDGSGASGGGGGSILSGNGGASNAIGLFGYYGGGGGGDGKIGGNSYYGGGGGGGVTSSLMGGNGTSAFAGNGSGGSVVTSGSVAAGTTPSGGGGGAYGAGSSGQGGSGMIRITTFL